MEWLLQPEPAVAFDFLSERLPSVGSAGKGLLLVGRMEVTYEGRAESRLGVGDRVVLVKSDGTLIVHNPDGLKPVNWQPAGCRYTCRRVGEQVEIEARRTRPEERVRMRLERVDALGVLALQNQAVLELKGTEFDIRDALRAQPELIEAGFTPWAKERISERGPMDLYGEDAAGRRVVVEVKRVRAGIAEATQLWRYVEKERAKREVEVRGILVAPGLSERAQLLLQEHGLEYRHIDLERLRERRLFDRPERTLHAFVSRGDITSI